MVNLTIVLSQQLPLHVEDSVHDLLLLARHCDEASWPALLKIVGVRGRGCGRLVPTKAEVFAGAAMNKSSWREEYRKIGKKRAVA
jgi:hypothetical protein